MGKNPLKPENVKSFETLIEACKILCPDQVNFLIESDADIRVDPRFNKDECDSVMYDLITMTLLDTIVLATRMPADDLYEHIKQLRDEQE